MEPVLANLNQMLINGNTLGQQGMFAETQGNYPGAAQWYDQSIGWIHQSMITAQQSGISIPDNIYFIFASAHFNAARVKNRLGWAPVARNHLNQSLAALNQAIVINPRIVQYHVGAGTVLMAMENLPEAERAFNTALQINPSEACSQYMLAILHSSRGNMAAANSYYASVQQVAPKMPAMSSLVTPGQGTNWLNTVNDACTLLNTVFKTIGTFQDLMKYFR